MDSTQVSPKAAQEQRILDWHDESGNDRDLVKAILGQRIDRVRIVSKSRHRITKCLALGFPADASEPRLRLRSASLDAVDSAAVPDMTSRGLFSDFARVIGASTPFWSIEGQLPDDSDVDASIDTLIAAGGDVEIPVGHTLVPELQRRGYRQTDVLSAMTLLPVLSTSTSPVLERYFQLAMSEIEAYGQQSGDLNPLHFDDEFARSHGFKRRISHGMLFNGWLTRLLGMEYPGPGTIFLRNSTSFYAPLYPENRYRVRISTPHHNAGKGLFQVLAQVFDEDGRHCTISYNDVMSRPPAFGQVQCPTG